MTTATVGVIPPCCHLVHVSSFPLQVVWIAQDQDGQADISDLEQKLQVGGCGNGKIMYFSANRYFSVRSGHLVA